MNYKILFLIIIVSFFTSIGCDQNRQFIPAKKEQGLADVSFYRFENVLEYGDIIKNINYTDVYGDKIGVNTTQERITCLLLFQASDSTHLGKIAYANLLAEEFKESTTFITIGRRFEDQMEAQDLSRSMGQLKMVNDVGGRIWETLLPRGSCCGTIIFNQNKTVLFSKNYLIRNTLLSNLVSRYTKQIKEIQ